MQHDKYSTQLSTWAGLCDGKGEYEVQGKDKVCSNEQLFILWTKWIPSSSNNNSFQEMRSQISSSTFNNEEHPIAKVTEPSYQKEFTSGQASYARLWEWPNLHQSSSAICGASGDNNNTKLSSTCFGRSFHCKSNFDLSQTYTILSTKQGECKLSSSY